MIGRESPTALDLNLRFRVWQGDEGERAVSMRSPSVPHRWPARPAHLGLSFFPRRHHLVRKGGFNNHDWKGRGHLGQGSDAGQAQGEAETDAGGGAPTLGEVPALEAPPTPGGGAAETQQTQGMAEPAHLNAWSGTGPVGKKGAVRRGNLCLAPTCP